MNQIILRVSGEAKNLNTIQKKLKQKLELIPENVWEKGTKNRIGRKIESSGFNIFIADSKTPNDLVGDIKLFINELREYGLSFSNVYAELSIGITVGEEISFIKTLDFPPLLLTQIAEHNLTLSVTAYPTTDDNKT